MPRALVARRIDLAAIESRPLVGVAHEIIGGGDLLELLLGLLVAGIEIRMQLFRQAAIGLLDVLLGGILFHTQDLVWIGAQRLLLSVGCVGSQICVNR